MINMLFAVITQALLWHTLLADEPGYELLASQSSSVPFDASILTSGTANIDDPTASTFSIIGSVSSSSYQYDGQYKFRLKFVTIAFEEQILEWTQTSWLTDDAVSGYNPISIPTRTNYGYGDGAGFYGLALSSEPRCYLDGNVDALWFNCIGNTEQWNGGTPCYNEEACSSMELWVYTEATLDTTTSNCGILAIDNFLLECSNEFESHSNTLSTLDGSIYVNSDLIGINTASITTLHSDVTTLDTSVDANSNLIGTNADSTTTLTSGVTTNSDAITVIQGEVAGISTLSDAITNVESSLSETNLRIDEFASFAAGVDPGLNVSSDASNLSLKYVIITGLLVINIISIAISMYICCNMNKGKKIHKFKNVDCETDDEENGLRS